MRLRIAIAGTIIGTTVGTTVGITVSRTVARWRKSWGHRPARSGQDAAGRRSGRRPRPPSIPVGSPSTRRPRRSGRGWSRWASGAPAGTATTGSTCRARAPTHHPRAYPSSRSATSSRRRRTAASRSASSSPGKALTLYLDTKIVARQAEAADSKAATRPDIPAGLAASSAILRTTPADFAAGWTFVLEPLDGGRTRLIERVRVRFGDGGAAFRIVAPAMGFGVFVMMQRQMLGLRERAMRTAVAAAPSAIVTRRPRQAATLRLERTCH